MADEGNWLDQVQEEIIDPERPICDPHHHLWDRGGNRYLLHELIEDTRGSGHNVVSTVFVEARSMYREDGPVEMRPVGETEFVQGIAAMSASGGYGPIRACAAIVSHADLALGAGVGPVLDAHMAASPNRFRGIRYSIAWDESDAIANSHTGAPRDAFQMESVQAGFAELVSRGLTFDSWLYHHQIPQLTQVARTFPNLTIIFDHFGGPLGVGPYAGRADEVFEAWKPAIDELAKCDNVHPKLGGINMAVNGFGWHEKERPPTSEELAAATERYYRYTIERFGPERCMFESNFPVDKVSCSYAVLWNTFKRIAADFSEDDKDKLFHDTAARVYRVEDSVTAGS